MAPLGFVGLNMALWGDRMTTALAVRNFVFYNHMTLAVEPIAWLTKGLYKASRPRLRDYALYFHFRHIGCVLP